MKILLEKLGNCFDKVGETCVWRKLGKEIVAEFLDSYKAYSRDPLGLTTRMPIDFIKKYCEKKIQARTCIINRIY